ncbi:MAG: molybdopterin converting factor subunit 1 [Hyphomicrobiaceae bacterium]|nr:molybdopterin converting factor subunit 1 [Hyphomicrobiaceae bacterium]
MTRGTTVKLLYFAWVREKVGRAEEAVELAEGVETVADLVAWIKSRGPEYAAAFERHDVIRAAVDRRHVQPSASIRGAREIAFFPPVTGG